MNPPYWISLHLRRLGTIGRVRDVRTESAARHEQHGGELAELNRKLQTFADDLDKIVRREEQTL